MDCEEIPEFLSPEDETAYWKELSLKYKQRYGPLWQLRFVVAYYGFLFDGC